MAKSFYIRVKQGDTLNKIYQKYNTCKQNIVRNNPEIDLYCGELIKIKTNDYISYIVKPTETLDKICDKFNIEKDKLIQQNDLKDTKLFIGQQLKIFK